MRDLDDDFPCAGCRWYLDQFDELGLWECPNPDMDNDIDQQCCKELQMWEEAQ